MTMFASGSSGTDAASVGSNATSVSAGTATSTSVIPSSSKYRSYVQGVERALKAFESTTEWADLISALQKLTKVFSTNSKHFSIIPKSVLVAKRLSQCLHPALPSGVHLKALETYRQLFAMIQNDGRLQKDLYLYAIGLFPLMDHCGIKVKGELMAIFDKFLLPMADDLRPALPGFIVAVLLALEEGTEFFSRAFNILDQLLLTVKEPVFYTCLWEAVLHSPSARLPALIFVNFKTERSSLKGQDQFMVFAGQDHADHMIAALCAVAEDTAGSALMHRHLLDFLASMFPLNSPNVTQTDFVQLLRRCLFIVLRRDMSLTRRLYQWILNKSGDTTLSIISANGQEDETDVQFFETYSLPLIKLSMIEFLKSDVVEVPIVTPVLGATGGSYEGTTEHQVQFTEVRLCRALQYFIDRPYFGMRILEEIMAIFLEFCCLQDANTIAELQSKCEALDATFSPAWIERVDQMPPPVTEFPPDKRLTDIGLNLNALLNNLEVDFVWKFLRKLFKELLNSRYKNESDDDDDANLTHEERQQRDFKEQKRKEHIVLFPVMVAFCLKNVQLDSHTDIRSKHLPKLLRAIMKNISVLGCDSFTRNNLVALIAVCRMLLDVIHQPVMTIETGVEAAEGTLDDSLIADLHHKFIPASIAQPPQTTNDVQATDSVLYITDATKEKQDEMQKCLEICRELLIRVCHWYTADRDRDKAGVLSATLSLLRDFADFPMYFIKECDSVSAFMSNVYSSSTSLPIWLVKLLEVVDVRAWQMSGVVCDFDIRSRVVDVLIYFYLLSLTQIHQHKAYSGLDDSGYARRRATTRTKSQGSLSGISINGTAPTASSPTLKISKTVLLKPILNESEILLIDDTEIFDQVARIFWTSLSKPEDVVNHQDAAWLLHRLHSRNSDDPSSDVEDAIITDLTLVYQTRAGEACQRFRRLWTLTRSSTEEEVYLDIPYKPFNRVIMILLGIICDEALSSRHSRLKTYATGWFIDCATHNDLPRIFTMLASKLLDPVTARVSVQCTQIQSRLTKDTVRSIPSDVNVITLVTANAKQALHHACRDVSTLKSNAPYTSVDCATNAAWVSDVKKHILALPQSDSTNYSLETTQTVESTPAKVNTHRRTISDIPQFDEDMESLGDVSIDSSVDPEVADIVACIVDAVCDDSDDMTTSDQQYYDVDRGCDVCLTPTRYRDSTTLAAASTPSRRSLPASFMNGQANGRYDDSSGAQSRKAGDDLSLKTSPLVRREDQTRSMIMEGVMTSQSLAESSSAAPKSAPVSPPKASASPPPTATPRVPPTPQQQINRYGKTGHRRTDSLQETIFSTTLSKLFDPSEMPKTEPGDDKQSLFDESQAHMLFYTEAPSSVDLSSAERIFRILSSLLRMHRGAAIDKLVANFMIFYNATPLIKYNNSQINEFMIRHFKAMQGEDFWLANIDQALKASTSCTNATTTQTTRDEANSDAPFGGTSIAVDGQRPGRYASFCELFVVVAIHYLRSYFLNSPISPVSEADLILSWDCKIAALDFLTDLLRHLTTAVADVASREFVNFALLIHQRAKQQRCLISFLLTAVPYPRSSKEVPTVSCDVAEFNGIIQNRNFSDVTYAYQRALLDFTSVVISLEYHIYIGRHIFPEQANANMSINMDRSIAVNKLNYNSSQTRQNIRDPRTLLVELKLFTAAVINAFQRVPDRHQLWSHFLISVLPYLENALPTISIHVVNQLCRNLDSCISYAYGHVIPTTFDTGGSDDTTSTTLPFSSRIKSLHSTGNPPESYPENYAMTLMEALTTIMHFCILDEPQAGSVPFANKSSTVVTPTHLAATTPTGGNISMMTALATSSTSAGASLASNNPSNMNTSSTSVSSVVNMIPGTKGATEMLGNLFSRVFTSSDSSGNMLSNGAKYDMRNVIDIWRLARDELIKHLPHFLSTICDIWAITERNPQPRLAIGSAAELQELVYSLINPIASRYPHAVINALSVVWMTRAPKTLKPDVDQLGFVYTDDQMDIAKMLLASGLPFQHAVHAIAESLKDLTKGVSTKQGGGSTTSPVLGIDRVTGVVSEVALLELLHGCVRIVNLNQLKGSWAAMNVVFNEAALNVLSPRCVFLYYKLFEDLVKRSPNLETLDGKTNNRPLHDTCQRLTEAVNSIIGWQLETTTWLKRTLVVRQDNSLPSKSGDTTPMMETKSLSSAIGAGDFTSNQGSTYSLYVRDARLSSHYDITGNASASQLVLAASASASEKKSSSNLRASLKDSTHMMKKDPANSTQALFLLADSLAEMIDSICKSEDKDRMLTTLQAVWANTLPYLKEKSARNARFFLASSKFLASMSTYNYMRPVWKKATLDLLFETNFFKMDIHSLKQWLIVIDNLMSNDKASFKELLNRIPSGNNSALSNLISSKDQEYDMRAQALKRVAFVVLSSQMDQYSNQLHEILERLSDNLRLNQVPHVHAQVFTCYRVLLIRMKQSSFVSIWPSMATELVQVLLQLETQIIAFQPPQTTSTSLYTQNTSTLDTASIATTSLSMPSSAVTSLMSDDLKCARDDLWMQLYLSACKLLETLCTLPAGYISQMQMCQWTFINGVVSGSDTDGFVPFAARIHGLLCSKFGELSHEEQRLNSASLQNIKTLTCFSELRPFFHALAAQHHTVVAGLTGGGLSNECYLHDAHTVNGSMTLKGAILRLEHSLYVDFAEHLQL